MDTVYVLERVCWHCVCIRVCMLALCMYKSMYVCTVYVLEHYIGTVYVLEHVCLHCVCIRALHWHCVCIRVCMLALCMY